MSEIYESIKQHYHVMTRCYNDMIAEVGKEEACNWSLMEKYLSANAQHVELVPQLSEDMQLSLPEIEDLRTLAEEMMRLQENVVRHVQAVKTVTGKGLQQQQSVKKVMRAYGMYGQAVDGTPPKFQDKKL